MTDTVCPLRAVSNWPITVAIVYVSLTTQKLCAKKYLMLQFCLSKQSLLFFAFYKKDKKDFIYIYTGIHKM